MSTKSPNLHNTKAAQNPPQNKAGFPLTKIKKSAKQLSKTFHSKVFTLFASTVSDIYSFSQRLSPHFTYGFMFLKNEEGFWFFDVDDALKVRKWILKKVQTNPKVLWGIYQAWKQDWKKFTGLSNKLLKTNLRNLSDQTFYELFDEYHKKYVLAGSVAYMTDSFMSTGTVDWLEKLLTKELNKNAKNTFTRDDIKTLLTPPSPTYSSDAEKLLLKILASRKSGGQSLLSSFSKKYYWIENNYFHVRFIDEKIAEQKTLELKEELQTQGLTAAKKLKLANLEAKKRHRDQLKILKKLKPSPFVQNLIKVAWLYGSWKDTRKSGVCIGMEHFDRFLTELARRTQYSKHELTFTIMPEVKSILMEEKDIKIELKKRQIKTFFAVTDKNYTIAGGKDADVYFKAFELTTRLHSQKLHGMCAQPGQVTGRVRVIRKTSEMSAFKNGEILVTNQTTPEFVPIMKKAAAIITEQGGITSHAAIISRELGIPCVIGTKIATKVFKDGDIVEVDANKGIITKFS